MNAPIYSLQFAPESAWQLVSSDDQRNCWVALTDTERTVAQGKYSGGNTASAWPNGQSSATARFQDETTIVTLDKSLNQLSIRSGSRSSNRVYISTNGLKIRIANGICHAVADGSRPCLSRQFLGTWIASALRFSNLDHFLGYSPFEGVHLITNGISLSFDLNTGAYSVSIAANKDNNHGYLPNSLERLIAECKTAILESVDSQMRDADCIAEFSGGIDSGLVSVIAKRVAPSRFHGGMFVNYPYHEFRKESEYVRRIALAEDISVLPGDPSFAEFWGAMIQGVMPQQVIEPSLFLPFWGQVLAGQKFLSGFDRAVVLTGLGGDLLFELRDTPYQLPYCFRPTWLARDVWDHTLNALANYEVMLESHGKTSSGIEYSNPWISGMLAREFPRLRYCSPLTDRAVVSSFAMLKSLLRELPEGHQLQTSNMQKPIAHLVFADYLPANVWHRRSKINFVGNFYRFWWKHGDLMVEAAKSMKFQLDSLGIDTRSFLKHLIKMRRGKNASDPISNAVVNYAYWAINHSRVLFN